MSSIGSFAPSLLVHPISASVPILPLLLTLLRLPSDEISTSSSALAHQAQDIEPLLIYTPKRVSVPCPFSGCSYRVSKKRKQVNKITAGLAAHFRHSHPRAELPDGFKAKYGSKFMQCKKCKQHFLVHTMTQHVQRSDCGEDDVNDLEGSPLEKKQKASHHESKSELMTNPSPLGGPGPVAGIPLQQDSTFLSRRDSKVHIPEPSDPSSERKSSVDAPHTGPDSRTSAISFLDALARLDQDEKEDEKMTLPLPDVVEIASHDERWGEIVGGLGVQRAAFGFKPMLGQVMIGQMFYLRWWIYSSYPERCSSYGLEVGASERIRTLMRRFTPCCSKSSSRRLRSTQ